MIMRENIILAPGQFILFFLTGNLDFQQAPGHRSRRLTMSHIWDCQKLPQKSPPQRACGNCWGGRARSIRPHARLEALVLPAAQGRPCSWPFSSTWLHHNLLLNRSPQRMEWNYSAGIGESETQTGAHPVLSLSLCCICASLNLPSE